MVRHDAAAGTFENPAIRLHLAAHQTLIEPINRLNHRLGKVVWIDSEHNARAIPGYDLLHHHRHGATLHIEAQFTPVEQRRIGPEGCPDEPDVL
jgi:hypothetical protein